jgi:hypothetical protein
MDNKDERGDLFAVTSTIANASLFVLTDVFMSNLDLQTKNESSAQASGQCMDHMMNARISGDATSKVDELNHVDTDAKA